VLEPQPLHGIVELDVDAQVIRIEFELIAFEQAGILVDIHDQLGHLAIELELPVAIARGLGLEVDAMCHGAGLSGYFSAAVRASMYRGLSTMGGRAALCIIVPY
jgi:hypothetical protein